MSVSTKEHYWNVILEPNSISEIPGALRSQFDPSGPPMTLGEASKLAFEGSAGVHEETMLAGYRMIESKVVEGLLNGRPYKGDYYSLHPGVHGQLLPGQGFDEVDHKLTFTCALNTKFRNLLKTVKVVLKGQKDFEDFAKITSVQDLATNTEGTLLTIGDDIYITGERIRVIGEESEDGVEESAVGVFFVPEGAGTIVKARRINKNDPSFLHVKVPGSLVEDKLYTVRIVTRYTRGDTMLTNLRTVDYHRKLKAVEDEDEDRPASRRKK